MDLFIKILFALALVFLIFYLLKASTKKRSKSLPIQPVYKQLLADHVPFYQKLPDLRKKEFEERLQLFLSRVKITGIKTEVEDIDRVFIASSAVIPIFNFPGWEYVNLKEVLLYPASFDFDFNQQGGYRNIMGMVGDGPLNHLMILSRQQLRHAFQDNTDNSNTAIHEFVHLVDKTDGYIDGIPHFILDKKYILPWLKLMQKEIQMIRENRSDINPYGASNEAEFFAVVSEYFFEQPQLLQQNHPELFDLLEKIFRRRDNG